MRSIDSGDAQCNATTRRACGAGQRCVRCTGESTRRLVDAAARAPIVLAEIDLDGEGARSVSSARRATYVDPVVSLRAEQPSALRAPCTIFPCARVFASRRGHAGGKAREGGDASVSTLPSASRTCASVE